jgi:DNA-binding CsgD family transcriptional regulator/tetratricopeptide (TPR) repeat protein
VGERVVPAGKSSALLERTDQLAALHESLGDVRRTGRGRVVLVGAEAGGGKTALLRRFSSEVAGRALWGACDPLFTPRPLGPLLTVAETVDGEMLDVLARGGLHELVSALARELGAKPGTVLVLDDLHWADEATLDVFRLLTRRLESVPALVLVGYRDAELDRHHPLRRVLGELATSDLVTRLKLGPLSLDGVAELSEPYGVDPQALFERTAGNPFFVVEALAAGADRIPETVKDAVLARAAPLGPSARSLLEAVAVVPSASELWLLQGLDGDALGSLDECLASGMLTAGSARVAFRHELARLAVEDSVPLTRKIELHRKALVTLADPPDGNVDLARLAHHAEGAGDREAVLRYAPEAGELAAALGSHREAAAQYARALRFGDGLTPTRRAELLERQTAACFVTDQYDEGIAAIREAAQCRRAAGDRLKEGDDTRVLSEFLWCPGRIHEAQHAAREAVTLLEALPPGPELAFAYANSGFIAAVDSRGAEAVRWSKRALDLAIQFDDLETAVYASQTIGACEADFELLEDTLARAEKAGLVEKAGRVYSALTGVAVESRRNDMAERHLGAGLAYCSEYGLELYRLYVLAHMTRFELDQGRWSEAAHTAGTVLRIPRTSTTPRIVALVVLALLRARRGDPEARQALEEAWLLAEPTGELPRLGPVAAARAEVAWLEGDREAVAEATEDVLALAVDRGNPWRIGELACWRARAGIDEDLPEGAAEPYALELAGDAGAAAAAWRDLGCPYDAALAAMSQDDEGELRRALDDLQRLGAKPAAAIVARRLRDLGARDLPRGPRPATRENPASLTPREVEVLQLVVEGLRNSEIAVRLFLSVKTVDHHVSAILRKLGVRSRGEAATVAVTQGLLARPDPA